ncbi:lipoprotein [Mesoplasma corruscae]|uniref:Uncharacterized protein n=1 Tax=Mesoplasma corruscae TaxID=216874 RepID=A0A2S5RGG7_9MOLU|nr:lipoprotein [Mesoplasma corruscae]PPE06426.1 hypothetical protein MCORR_v1c00540 [Mesoplasma corruscae]
MKKLLSIFGATSLVATSGSFVIRNNNNINLNYENKEDVSGKTLEKNTISIMSVSSKIHELAKSKTFKSIEDADNEIINNKLEGTQIKTKDSDSVISDSDGNDIINDYVSISFEASLLDDYQWDNDWTEGVVEITAAVKIDNREVKEPLEVSKIFDSLYTEVPATDDKVAHKRYFYDLHKATVEILNTNFQDGEIINVKLKDPLKDSTFINEEVSFVVEVMLKKKWKWNNNLPSSINTFEFKLKVDQRTEVQFENIKEDILSKISNSKKYYSESEAIDAINNYKNTSEIEQIKNGDIELEIKEKSYSQDYPLSTKEFEIVVKLNSEKIKWSDETTSDKKIDLSTTIDTRQVVKNKKLKKYYKILSTIKINLIQKVI